MKSYQIIQTENKQKFYIEITQTYTLFGWTIEKAYPYRVGIDVSGGLPREAIMRFETENKAQAYIDAWLAKTVIAEV